MQHQCVYEPPCLASRLLASSTKKGFSAEERSDGEVAVRTVYDDSALGDLIQQDMPKGNNSVNVEENTVCEYPSRFL